MSGRGAFSQPPGIAAEQDWFSGAEGVPLRCGDGTIGMEHIGPKTWIDGREFADDDDRDWDWKRGSTGSATRSVGFDGFCSVNLGLGWGVGDGVADGMGEIHEGVHSHG